MTRSVFRLILALTIGIASAPVVQFARAHADQSWPSSG
jgi:hypothetical protein